MELFIKCIAIAILASISSVILKRYLPEVSIAILVCACVILFVSISGVLKNVLEFITTLAQRAGISSELLNPVFKVTAIAILSKMACDICRDSGANSLIAVVELCAGVIAIVLSIPLFDSVLGLITRM